MAFHEKSETSNKDMQEMLPLGPADDSGDELAEVRDLKVESEKRERRESSAGALALEQAMRDDARERGLRHDQDEIDDNQLDDAADKLGNYFTARRRLDTPDPDTPNDNEAEIIRLNTTRKNSRVNSRGGRAYPELSDSAADPYWSSDGELLSPEERARQQAINQRGRQPVQEILDQQEWQRIQNINDPKERKQAEIAFTIARRVR